MQAEKKKAETVVAMLQSAINEEGSVTLTDALTAADWFVRPRDQREPSEKEVTFRLCRINYIHARTPASTPTTPLRPPTAADPGRRSQEKESRRYQTT